VLRQERYLTTYKKKQEDVGFHSYYVADEDRRLFWGMIKQEPLIIQKPRGKEISISGSDNEFKEYIQDNWTNSRNNSRTSRVQGTSLCIMLDSEGKIPDFNVIDPIYYKKCINETVPEATKKIWDKN
jgi:hypothetical protein